MPKKSNSLLPPLPPVQFRGPASLLGPESVLRLTRLTINGRYDVHTTPSRMNSETLNAYMRTIRVEPSQLFCQNWLSRRVMLLENKHQIRVNTPKCRAAAKFPATFRREFLCVE